MNKEKNKFYQVNPPILKRLCYKYNCGFLIGFYKRLAIKCKKLYNYLYDLRYGIKSHPRQN